MSKKETKKSKGFTLIEVLGVIVIIIVISGISYYTYINLIKNSKDKSFEIAMDNIKSAAELYGKEKNKSINWFKAVNANEEYACVTVMDMINNGFFKKDFYKNEIYQNSGIKDNSYIQLTRDIKNYTITEATIITSPEIDSLSKCVNKTLNDKNNTSFNLSGESIIYTDTIALSFYEKEETTEEENEEGTVETINNNTEDVNEENYEYIGAIKYEEDTKWKTKKLNEKLEYLETSLQGVPNREKPYEVRICKIESNTEVIEEYLENINNNNEKTIKNKCFIINEKLKDFETPQISFDPDVEAEVPYREVTIKYNDDNIYEDGYYYFMSDANGILENDYELLSCNASSLENVNSSNCTTTDTNKQITKNTIYLLKNGSEINFKIKEDINDTDHYVYATIKDKTGNYKKEEKSIQKINTSLPGCEIVLTGTTGKNGYYKSDVTVTLNNGIKSDSNYSVDVSGLVKGGNNPEPTNGESSLKQTENTNGTTYYGYVRYKNKDGTYTYDSKCNKTVKIDKTAPTCTNVMRLNSSTGSNYSNGTWTTQNVYTAPSYSDGQSGYDASSTTLTTRGSTTNVTNAKYQSWIVQATGSSTLTYTVYDKAGNSKTCDTITAKVDKTNPTCSFTNTKYTNEAKTKSAGAYSNNTWYSGYFRSVATCGDTESGCNGTYVTVTGNSSNTTKSRANYRDVDANGVSYVTWYARDGVGHEIKCGNTYTTVKLDRKAPSCDESKSKTNTTSGVTAKFKCKDNPTDRSNSGVKKCTETKTGLKATKSYTIKDNAGNEGTCKVKVSSKKQYRYIQKVKQSYQCNCSYVCPRGYSGYGWISGSYWCAQSGAQGGRTRASTRCQTCSRSVCGSSYGSWGGGNTGCSSQNRTLYY